MPVKKLELAKEKYKDNTFRKGETWLKNFRAVIDDMLERGTSDKAEKKFASKMLEAIDKKRRQAHLKAVTPADVEKAAEEAGKDNYNKSVEAKAFKMLRFQEAWWPILESEWAENDKLPDETPDQRDAKALDMIHRLREKKGAWRR